MGKRGRRERNSIYKIGEVIEYVRSKMQEGEEWERKAGNIREGILLAFFSLIFENRRRNELENGIILYVA